MNTIRIYIDRVNYGNESCTFEESLNNIKREVEDLTHLDVEVIETKTFFTHITLPTYRTDVLYRGDVNRIIDKHICYKKLPEDFEYHISKEEFLKPIKH